MEWRDNLHKFVKRVIGDLPAVVIDAIDAAYVAGMDECKNCTRCNGPFEKHHHRHIVGDKIYHTRCYQFYKHEKR